jgi:hypothetical protein
MAPANGNALLPRWRYAAAALTSVPMFNIFATDGVLKIVSQVTPNMTIANSQVAQIVWTVVCTANGVSLLLALICMVYLAIRLASATAVEAASSQS